MQRLTLVVAGAARLAEAMEATGQFEKVHSVTATSGLKDLIAAGMLRGSKDSMVFLFADNLPVDTPGTPMGMLMQTLTTGGYKVIVVGVTPEARDMVATYPRAGLLPVPFSINQAIGAIAGMNVPGLEPVDGGFDPIDLDSPVPFAGLATPPAQPFAAPSAAPPPFTQPPAAPSGFSAPPSFTEPPAAPSGFSAPPSFAEPAAAPSGFSAPPSFTEPAAAPSGFSAPPSFTEPAAPPSGFNAPVSGFTSSSGGSDWEIPPSTGPVGGAQGGFNTWPAPTSNPLIPAEPEAPRRMAPPSMLPTGLAEAAGPGAMIMPATRQGYTGAQETGVPARRGHVITVTAPKGGTGKSSLTLNLGAYLGHRLRGQGKRVCVIDANFQQADSGKYLNCFTPNIANLVKDPSTRTVDRIEEFLIKKNDLGMHVLLGPAKPSDANPAYINAKLYSQILEVLRELYDYILIDTPVAEKYHDIFAGFALPQADFLIVAINPNYATLLNTDNWLRAVTAPKHVGGDDVDPAKVGVVLNRAKDGIDCSEEDVRTELAAWRFIGAIPETDEWQKCNNNNELVATKNYRDLSEAFARVLYAATGEEVLTESISAPSTKSKGLAGLIKRLRKG
jgi:MinD-like ATPase involved in chromosome partitioning or flagellar assembly